MKSNDQRASQSSRHQESVVSEGLEDIQLLPPHDGFHDAPDLHPLGEHPWTEAPPEKSIDLDAPNMVNREGLRQVRLLTDHSGFMSHLSKSLGKRLHE
jgi:hypothetical protein